MASSTPNLSLRKPTNADLVNVATDLSENFDKIDAHVTSPTAHSGTYVPLPAGGSNNNVLTKDTAEALGVKWAAAGGATVPLLGTYTVGAAQNPVFRMQSSEAALGPFSVVVQDYANAGASGAAAYNTVGRFGYNADGTKAGEPRWHFTLEANYYPDPATRWLEAYLESTSGAVTVRPFMYIIAAATGRITSSVFRVDKATQGFQIRNDIDETDIAQFAWGTANIYGKTGASTNLNLFTASGQSSIFNMFHDGTARFVITTGDATITTIRQGGYVALQVCGRSDMAGIGLGDNPAAIGGVVAIKLQNAASGGYAAFMAAARTTPVAGQDLYRATDSAYAIWTRINHNGYFMTRKVAAPADADLVANEMALWFDATNGAAKLMVKAKEAGGTVRTGEVALA